MTLKNRAGVLSCNGNAIAAGTYYPRPENDQNPAGGRGLTTTAGNSKFSLTKTAVIHSVHIVRATGLIPTIFIENHDGTEVIMPISPSTAVGVDVELPRPLRCPQGFRIRSVTTTSSWTITYSTED